MEVQQNSYISRSRLHSYTQDSVVFFSSQNVPLSNSAYQKLCNCRYFSKCYLNHETYFFSCFSIQKRKKKKKNYQRPYHNMVCIILIYVYVRFLQEAIGCSVAESSISSYPQPSTMCGPQMCIQQMPKKGSLHCLIDQIETQLN